MKLIDTHCHLDFNRFDDDRDDVIERAERADVQRIIVPGLDLESSLAAVALAERYMGIYAAIGFHPNSIGPSPIELKGTLDTIRDLAAHDKVVAIGEIGLDYYWDKTSKEIQHRWLEAQLVLAADLGLPVILHNRESTSDILNLLRQWVDSGLPQSLLERPGVLHSFSASWADAQQALALGFYLGFTGPITFRKAAELRLVAGQIPSNRLLVETDSPFLTPHPHRGQRNEPAHIRIIAGRLAEIRSMQLDEVAEMTTANAERLFALPPWPDE